MKVHHQRRDPELCLGCPDWFHPKGAIMRVKRANEREVFICGSAAAVRITRALASEAGEWSVDWEILDGEGGKVSGNVGFSTAQLRGALGLSEESGELGDWVISRYGADAAEQGKFIRWLNFLNIPCPGTGHDGDPNVSVFLDDMIRGSVRRLLEAA